MIQNSNFLPSDCTKLGRFIGRIGLVLLFAAPWLGCQSLMRRDRDVDLVDLPEPITQSGVVTAGAIEDPNSPGANVVQADGDAAAYYDGEETGNRLVGFFASLRENIPNARKAYQKGDNIFRSAASKSRDGAQRDFSRAASYFRDAGDSAPGSALQQDALFMQAESHFFANELNDATKTYQKLQKEFPRNRHNDRVAARLFSISKYWIDSSKAGREAWYKINMFDSSLPSYDIAGQAVSVLDQIRYDDPTGRLADDATMAAAMEYLRQRDFEKADEFLSDLRKVFTDSEHMFMAHLLGVQCKLELYAGPNYSGLVLEEAETLIRQTRERFPDQLRQSDYSEMLARAAKAVSYHQAERLETRAKYREKKKEFGAATVQYQQLVEKYPSTPQAKIARARLGDVQRKPAIPQQRLAWLTKIFPDSKQSSPLQMVDGKRQPKSTGNTMLR